MQQALYENNDNAILRMPCCIIQEDREKSSQRLDSDAFLQCYIEAVAQIAADFAFREEDKCFATAGHNIAWPTLWFTKILESIDVKDGDERTPEEIIYREDEVTGVRTCPIYAKQLALQSLTQLCVPVSIGALQAGLAYLRLYGDMKEEVIKKSLYLDEESSERILRDFRGHQANMLDMLLSLPRVSVISPHAIR